MGTTPDHVHGSALGLAKPRGGDLVDDDGAAVGGPAEKRDDPLPLTFGPPEPTNHAERRTVLVNAPPAFIAHNTSIEPRNPDEPRREHQLLVFFAPG